MADNNSSHGGIAGRDITDGFVTPGSDLEAASIASGIPPASLDVYYDDSDAEKHQHEHSYGGSQTP
jgi:hypothetical protein